MTAKSIDRANTNAGLQISDKCKEHLNSTIHRMHKLQDKWYGAAPNAYHFCRRIGESKAIGETNYQNVLTSLRSNFDSELAPLSEGDEPCTASSNKAEGCLAALEALGKLTHAWQDFYSHAITEKEESAVVWAGGNGGDPYVHPGLVPPAWGHVGTGTEHGTGLINETANRDVVWGEPHTTCGGCTYGVTVTRDVRINGTRMRREAAEAFVAGKYADLLKIWKAKCKCCCPPPVVTVGPSEVIPPGIPPQSMFPPGLFHP